MDSNFRFRYRYALISFAVIAIAVSYFIVPFQSRPKAARTLFEKTQSIDPGLPNYDIRTDKKAYDKIAGFRALLGKNASQVADIRDSFVRGEDSLRKRLTSLKVEYNNDIQTPEVITPDVQQGRNFLTAASRPAGSKHADVLLNFLTQNTELVGTKSSQIENLRVAADYTNPDGNLSFVELDQEINGIPVFRGEVKAGFSKNGEMIRVINNLAAGLEYETLSTNFGEPAAAVSAAATFINNDGSKLDMRKNDAESSNIKTVFGKGDSATIAEKMYFPTEPGVAVPAWRVLIWQPANAFYVVVDAQSGTLLWRKNIGADQTQAATYSVYVNPNAMMNVAHSPFPFSPSSLSPNGSQAVGISRTSVTRIGNESPYSFNQLGWITDGGAKTDGNNVQAGLDRDGVDGVDTNSEAVSASRNFTFNFNPFNPNTNSGDTPVPVPQTYPGSAFQQGGVTNLFYICNWYHDETYRLGFTEAARNFQQVNFTGQGNDGDRVRAEGQDSSGVNNANFDTAADGIRGRMQMYLFIGPAPDIDGNFDADVIVHEHTHGLSNRLHGNASGLTLAMSNAMGEGWSDFYGLSLLSQASDPINAAYTTGGYDTYLYSSVGTNNNYYGIRRFPYAVMSFTGPNGRPHNPLTFADIDATKMNLNDGAFSPRFVPTPDEVHAAGEVWCSALWEVRARMIARLGWEVGNRRALQIVTDGMKLAPLSPTFLTERDAIIAAAFAGGSQADVADIWAGFAIRGMGASASIQNLGSASGDTRVTEAFNLPNLLQTPNLTIADPSGNHNGFADPGETISLTIPISNSTGNTATNVTLQIEGGNSVSYGTIESGTTVSRDIAFALPAATPCGSVITVVLNVSSSLGAVSFTRTIAVGQANTTFSQNFDGVTAPAIPSGWTAASVSGGVNFVTTTNTPDSAPNTAFALDPSSVGGGTDLTSPSIPVSVAAATVTFRHSYNTEAGWDGGVLEISINGAAFQDITTAGGVFLQNGYNLTLGAGTNNPLANRNAWTGNSSGFITTIVRLPAAASGQNVRLKWRFGADDNTVGTGSSPGWRVDSIQVAGNFSCSSVSAIPKSRADFDGDGKTDLSVFRPADGNWFVQRSNAGFTVVNWGLSNDILTPGDYDGDGKTDMAVWRPSTGIWFIINSANNQVSATQFGQAGDIPQAGDFDGDGKDDLVVWRPSTGVWFRINSSNGQTVTAQFGQIGDKPVVGDYDGDGKRDLAVFRPSGGLWYITSSSTGQVSVTQFGLSTDLPTPADYDGDNRDDISVFRPSEGNWYRLNSNGGQFVAIHYGQNGDLPIPGDYDGDGKDDQAVYRGSGIWFENASTSGSTAIQFGLTTDVPIPGKYIPPIQ